MIVGNCKQCNRATLIKGESVVSKIKYDFVCLYCMIGYWVLSDEYHDLEITIHVKRER